MNHLRLFHAVIDYTFREGEEEKEGEKRRRGRREGRREGQGRIDSNFRNELHVMAYHHIISYMWDYMTYDSKFSHVVAALIHEEKVIWYQL